MRRQITLTCIPLLLLLSFYAQPSTCDSTFGWFDEMDPDYKRGGVPQTLKLNVGFTERARFYTSAASVEAYVCLVEDQDNPNPKGIPTCKWIASWDHLEDKDSPWVDWKVSYYDLPRGRDKLYFMGMNNSAGLSLFWYPSRHFAITEADGSWPVGNSTITTTTTASPSPSQTASITARLDIMTTSTAAGLDVVTTTSSTSGLQPTASGAPALSSGQIAGVIAGVLGAAVVLVLASAVCCLRDRTKRQRSLSKSGKSPETKAGPEIAGNPIYEAEGGPGKLIYEAEGETKKPPEMAGNAVFEAPVPNPDGTVGTIPVYALGVDGQGNSTIYELPADCVVYGNNPLVLAPEYQTPAAQSPEPDGTAQLKD